MIITAKEQRTAEARAVEKGVSLIRLMQTAGESVFSVLREGYELKDLAVCALCGNGGNGGDGFVAARMLKQAGARPVIVLCSGTPKANAPSLMYKQAVSEGVPVLDIQFEREKVFDAVSKSGLIIDAVYGIGFRGKLNASMDALFREVNRTRAPTVAVDVPSGVNADTGEADENAVRADITVCFIAKKPANILKSARLYCGTSVLADIGIPEECLAALNNELKEIDAGTAAKILSPRPEIGHKGDFGRLMITAGSDRYRGAAVIAALGAYQTGAGLVAVASAEKALPAVAAQVPEAILFDICSDKEDYIGELKKSGACLIGCGLTTMAKAKELFTLTLGNAACPLVIDADGLNLLASDPSLFELLDERTILTPHIGEFSRLTGMAAEEILKDRVKHAREYAVKHGITLALKSENTVVATADGRAYINTIGNSGLAKAGSGDLLAGMTAALLAMGKSPVDAAVAGVYLHSLAADLATEEVDKHSLTASYISGYIGGAYAKIFSDPAVCDE